MPVSADTRSLISPLVDLAVKAGREILSVRAAGADVHTKDDLSPVTDADIRAEAILLEGLSVLLPGVSILAEECASRGILPQATDTFLAVDPLDGTREFISGRPEYTVNIGLVVAGRPLLGVLHAPSMGRTYWGLVGEGAARALHTVGAMPAETDFSAITTRRPSSTPPVALTSRGHNDEATESFLNVLGCVERQRIGSSLKFALVAEGSADLYARFGNTMEWDTAAGDAIVTAAGGIVTDPFDTPLSYGQAQAGYRNGALIAWGEAPRA